MSSVFPRAALALAALAGFGHPVAEAGSGPPPIAAIEIRSPHRVPEERLRAVIGDLVGRPRWRGAVRESLTRLWSLGLVSSVRVEEIVERGGVRLVYHVERRPHVGAIEFRGDLGLDEVDLAEVAGLGRGDHADPARLGRALADLRALYRREGYLGAEVRVEETPEPVSNARDISFVVRAGEPAQIGDVEIRADARVADAVREALGRQRGRRYREAILREVQEAVLRRLRRDGYLAARVNVEPPAWDRATDRVHLVVDVVEGPKVTVVFEGAAAIAEGVLRDRLTIAVTGVLDEAEVGASARQLEAAYREQGYHFAEVRGSLAGDARQASVRYEIAEGPQVTVESVTVRGTRRAEAARLEAQMQTRPPGLLDRGLFRQDVLERDVQALLAGLHARGFPAAQISPPEIRFSEDRTRVEVVVTVEEGRPARVGRVSVLGAASVVTDAPLVEAVPLRSGEPWSRARAEEGVRVLTRRLARLGHHGAEVTLATAARDDGSVDVVYRIEEGPRTRVGRIIVRGLTRTREHVVRRELPFREGDPLDPEALVEAQRRLTASFERVEVEPLRPPATPFADVEVTVREGKPWHVAFGVGYSTFEEFRGFVEGGHDNLFGTARSLGLRLRASQRGERADLLYGEPWLLGSRWRGDASLFYERQEEIGFKLQRIGLGLGARRDLGSWLRGLGTALRYEVSQVTRFDVDATLAAEDVVRGSQTIASLTPELVLDRRDGPLDPRRGSYHLLSVETAGLALAGDVDYVKASAETHWFFDWLPPTVVALSARAGLASPLADTPALPIEKRFFAGGSTTVRGYRERRLGPVDAKGNPTGGDAQAILNAEWRFPLWRWLGGVVFVDTGQVVEEVGDLGTREFRSGVGGGIRFSTPVGPVRIDVGYPLDRVERQDQQFRVYFTVGHPF